MARHFLNLIVWFVYSGEELLRVRNRDQTLLPCGEKIDEAVGSWMEEKMVESRLQEHHSLLQEPKIARK